LRTLLHQQYYSDRYSYNKNSNAYGQPFPVCAGSWLDLRAYRARGARLIGNLPGDLLSRFSFYSLLLLPQPVGLFLCPALLLFVLSPFFSLFLFPLLLL
jgi:hypothetical protein